MWYYNHIKLLNLIEEQFLSSDSLCCSFTLGDGEYLFYREVKDYLIDYLKKQLRDIGKITLFELDWEAAEFGNYYCDKFRNFLRIYKKIQFMWIDHNEEVSDTPFYDTIEGTSIARYIGCLFKDLVEEAYYVQEEFEQTEDEKAIAKFEKNFLDIYYSPRTAIGKRRLDREYDKLLIIE